MQLVNHRTLIMGTVPWGLTDGLCCEKVGYFTIRFFVRPKSDEAKSRISVHKTRTLVALVETLRTIFASVRHKTFAKRKSRPCESACFSFGAFLFLFGLGFFDFVLFCMTKSNHKYLPSLSGLQYLLCTFFAQTAETTPVIHSLCCDPSTGVLSGRWQEPCSMMTPL